MILKYPLFLFLLPVLWALLVLAMKSPGSLRRLFFPISHRQFKPRQNLSAAVLAPVAMKAIGLAFLVLCLARPVSSSSETRRLAEGIDIMISLDVSQSMLIEDMADKNRMEVARETIKKFIQGRSDDRIGFSIFSGDAVTLCPPTLDYQTLLDSVDVANVNLLKDGTAIGDGLAIAVNRLKDSRAKSKVVILATDGDSNMGAIAPLTAGDIAAGYGIKVYSIAMGSEGLVKIPQIQTIFGVQRKTYAQVESTINPSLLMKISQETGGRFFRAQDADALNRVFEEIDKLEKTKVETKDRVLWEERFQPYLLIAIVFFFLEMILRVTIFRVLPG